MSQVQAKPCRLESEIWGVEEVPEDTPSSRKIPRRESTRQQESYSGLLEKGNLLPLVDDKGTPHGGPIFLQK